MKLRHFRRALMALVGVLVVAGAAWGARAWWNATREPIVVGILHSRTGPMAISESSMVDAEVLALEQINAAGGLLGRPLKWIIADGESDWPTYARKARQLIREDHVNVIFGCWTSASRKSVLPVVESEDHLLFYPMAYEGLEMSQNIFYTGAAPNQQLIPTVKWCYDQLKARKFFLVGSDYIWPHTVNAIVKDQLTALGAELVGEEYIFFGSAYATPVVEKIVATKPDVILSSVVGDSNLAFYARLRESGVRPEQTPVISFSIAEDEMRKLSARDLAGNYSAWNYFMSIDRPENHQFVKAFQARYGKDRITSDVICAAYNSVRIWAQAVVEAGTPEIPRVREVIDRQSLNAPEGVVSIDGPTNHTWRPVYIARVRPDGQFDIVWTSQKPVRPVPYPISRPRAEWDAFVNGLFRKWGNNWANPVDPTVTSKGS